MDAEVGKLAEKAENLQIKEKSPKEWNDLPLEMKEEVVKRVDFKSSLRLRQTARLERALVDSRKFDLFNIVIDIEELRKGYVWVAEDSEKNDETNSMSLRYTRNRSLNDDIIPFITHVLKVGNIEKMSIDTCGVFFRWFLKPIDTIRVKHVELRNSQPLSCLHILLSKVDMENRLVSLRVQMPSYRDRVSEDFEDLSEAFHCDRLELHFFQRYLSRIEFSKGVKAFFKNFMDSKTVVVFPVMPGEAEIFSDTSSQFYPIYDGAEFPHENKKQKVRFEVTRHDKHDLVEMHIEKATKKVENLEVLDESAKNWNDLSEKLKVAVIKYVDFESSLCLRLTARAERNLVDKKRFDFSKVDIQARYGKGSVTINDSFTWKTYRNFEELAPGFIAHILNIGKIDKLTINCQTNLVTEFLKMTKSIRIKNLEMMGSHLLFSAFRLVSISAGNLATVSIYHNSEGAFNTNRDRLLDICKIYGARLVEIFGSDYCLYRYDFSDIVMKLTGNQNYAFNQVICRVKTNEAVLQLPAPPSLANNFERGQFERKIVSGYRLPTMDDDLRCIFNVSEPRQDSDFQLVRMLFVPA